MSCRLSKKGGITAHFAQMCQERHMCVLCILMRLRMEVCADATLSPTGSSEEYADDRMRFALQVYLRRRNH